MRKLDRAEYSTMHVRVSKDFGRSLDVMKGLTGANDRAELVEAGLLLLASKVGHTLPRRLPVAPPVTIETLLGSSTGANVGVQN